LKSTEMIHVANSHNFDFGKVNLSTPVATHTGGFYTKITYSNAEDSLFVYSPRCRSREGIVSVQSNKKYVDLVFTSTTGGSIVDWTFSLEDRLQTLIWEKRSAWFTDDLELDDIQSSFKQAMTAFKGGLFVLRAYVQLGRTKFPSLPQVFDVNENQLSLDDVHPESDIITILDFQGIRFTSRSFSIVVAVKQIMVLQKAATFQQCLIRPKEDELSGVSKVALRNEVGTQAVQEGAAELAKVEEVDQTRGEEEADAAEELEKSKAEEAARANAEGAARATAEDSARAKAEEAAKAKALAEASYFQALERARRLEEEVQATMREVEQLKGSLTSKP
jgi:hypothetical protein